MSFQKDAPFRSRKLLDSFRDAPSCFGCQQPNDGTVVGAHGNGHQFGKAAGQKAHDFYTAGLCNSCHTRYDQGSDMSREEKATFFLEAWRRTVAWWFQSKHVKPA